MSKIPAARLTVLGAWALMLAIQALAPGTARAQAVSATMEWDPVGDSRVAGYMVFVSSTTGAEWSLDVGTASRVTIPDLLPGVAYVFSVAAYAADRSLGDRSLSLSWPIADSAVASASPGELATTLDMVTAIAALEDGRALFIEDGRRLRLTQPGTLQSQVVAEVTDPSYLLSGVTLASDFATSHLVYVNAVHTLANGDREGIIARSRLLGGSLGETAIVVSGLPPSAAATAVDGLGRIYVAVSADATVRRFPASYLGSILRFNADGTVPGLSPVFSRGLNQSFALAFNDADDLLWLAGHDGVRSVLLDVALSDSQSRPAVLDRALTSTGTIVSVRARRGMAGIEGIVIDGANRRAVRFLHSSGGASSSAIELPQNSTPIAADIAQNGQVVIALRKPTGEVVLFRVAASAR